MKFENYLTKVALQSLSQVFDDKKKRRKLAGSKINRDGEEKVGLNKDVYVPIHPSVSQPTGFTMAPPNPV